MIEVKCPKCGYPWLVSTCVTCHCGTVLYAYKGLHQDDHLSDDTTEEMWEGHWGVNPDDPEEETQ